MLPPIDRIADAIMHGHLEINRTFLKKIVQDIIADEAERKYLAELLFNQERKNP